MRAIEIAQSVEALIESQVPVFVWGSPGIGKSSIIKQIAQKGGYEFVDLRLSLLDPTDLKGIPFFDSTNHQAVWAAPNFLPKDPQSRGILFLDEINTAPPSVQASAYQLVLDRKVGDYTLPDGWSIVAAGNHESDRGIVYRMPPALSNRFVHLDMEVGFDEWKSWAYGAGIDSRLIAFLGYARERLFDFEPKANAKSFPTPRSWEFVHKILHSQMPPTLLRQSIAGAVGVDSANSFLAFVSVMDRLPDIDALLSGAPLDIDHDTQLLFALIAGIVSSLQRDSAIERIDHAIALSMQLPKEYAIMLIKDMQQSSIAVESSSSWDGWVDEFAHLLV